MHQEKYGIENYSISIIHFYAVVGVQLKKYFYHRSLHQQPDEVNHDNE